MTEKQQTFPFFSDPGHGWIRVKKTLLKELGVDNRITRYSYQKGEYAYLEEDCDASIFCSAWEKVNGQKIKFEGHTCNGRSAIRMYETYCNT